MFKITSFIFKRTKPAQIFIEFQSETFQSLSPIIADAWPNTFGKIIFQEWLTIKGIQKGLPLQ